MMKEELLNEIMEFLDNEERLLHYSIDQRREEIEKIINDYSISSNE